MKEQPLAVVRYRSRATLRHRRGSYVSLVILVGLIAGLGLGSLAAARRTQSSFSTFLASTNPSDLTVSVYGGGGGSTNPNYDPALTARIAHLPGVRHVAAAVELTGAPLTPDGSPRLRVTGEAYPIASINGLLFSQDRPGLTAGRMSSPDAPDQIVMAPIVAKQFGFHLGQVIPYGFYSDAQQGLPGFGTNAVRPALRANFKLVGLVSLNSEIVEDDVDTLPTLVPLSPAFAREVLAQNGSSSPAPSFTGSRRRGVSPRCRQSSVRSQPSFPPESSPPTMRWYRSARRRTAR